MGTWRSQRPRGSGIGKTQLACEFIHRYGQYFAGGVAATAQDSAGNIARGTFSVTVRDTTAPIFQSLTASPHIITDPNGKMVPVALTAQVSDLVDPTLDTRIVSVTSNEPVDGLFGGDAVPE